MDFMQFGDPKPGNRKLSGNRNVKSLVAYAPLGTIRINFVLGSSSYDLEFGREDRHNVAVTVGR